MNGPRVSSLGLARVFLRSLLLQASWNPQGMQNLGFADAIRPALRELYPDRAARARAALRHLEFFNCHPYLAAAVLGCAVRLEERVAGGQLDGESVSQLKRALAPPFAALGDGFFWLALRPAAALAGALTMPVLGLWSLAVFLALYNVVHLTGRVWLFIEGYRRAEGIIEVVSRARVPSGTGLLKGTAAVLAGALAGRAILVAALPQRYLHGLVIAAVIAATVLLVPRVRFGLLVYTALALGLALGGGFL